MSRPGTIGKLAAAGAAVSLLIAGCSSPGQSTSESSTTTAGAAASGSAAAGSGAAGSGAAATGDPIKVGVVTSLSGPLQSYGQIYLDAFNACLT